MNSFDFVIYLESKSCIFWDWNGTLLDDLDYSIGITNDFLKSHKIATLSKQSYQEIFTIPVCEYYGKLDLTEQCIDPKDLAKHFIDNYKVRRDSLQLFEGTHELLKKLKEANIIQLLFSAAHISELEFQVRHHNVSEFFEVLSGAGDFLGGSKLDRGRALKEEYSFTNGVVVGDTLHDVEIGKDIGFETVWVSKGHQSLKRANGHPAVDYIFDRKKNIFYSNI